MNHTSIIIISAVEKKKITFIFQSKTNNYVEISVL